MFMCLVYCKCINLFVGGLKDNLRVPRQAAWAVYLCLTKVSLRIGFSEEVAHYKMFIGKLRTSL